jgi:hypothetical protein
MSTQQGEATPIKISQSKSLVLLFRPSRAWKFHTIPCKNARLAHIRHTQSPATRRVRILECRKSTDFNVDSYGSLAHRNRLRGVDGRQFFAVKYDVTAYPRYADTDCNICALSLGTASILEIRIFVTYSFQTGLGDCYHFPVHLSCCRPYGKKLNLIKNLKKYSPRPTARRNPSIYGKQSLSSFLYYCDSSASSKLLHKILSTLLRLSV